MRLWTSKILLATVPLLALLFAAGCGGGGSSSGGGGGTPSKSGITVTISPAAVTVVLNGTSFFSSSVAGAKTATIAATGGAVRASNVTTITTLAAHGFTSGATVIIFGVLDTSFNGTFVIASVPSTTTFTFAQTAADASSGSGSVSTTAVKWSVNDTLGGNSTVGTISTTGLYTAPAALPAPLTATIAANGIKRASSVVTVTTAADHNFLPGQIILVSGVADTTFNGTFTIATIPTTTTFTYAQLASDATSTGGTLSSSAVKVKAVSTEDSTALATAVVNLNSGVAVSVTPASATVGTSENFQFTSTVRGTSNTAVNWFVNEVGGGNATFGTISSSGVYTAPATPPSSTPVTIAASTGAVRNSNSVTITTTAAHNFQVGQSVVIAGVADTSFNGTFPIATVPSTVTFTFAQIAANATSGGGTATLSTTSVTVKAVAAADPLQSATATVTLIAPSDPTLTAVHPATAAQGAALLDLYLVGTNFLSTTTVRVGGTVVPSTLSSSTVLLARVPASLLAATGIFQVDVRRQNGFTTTSFPLTVVPSRPALVGSSPDSARQSSGAVSVNFNGGYFNPSTTAEFNGQLRAASPLSTQQMNVAVSASDISVGGLFPIVVRNSGAPQPIAATNLAVQPTAAPSTVATVVVGTQPAAVAVNTGTGIAVVANRGSNNISLISLGTNAVTNTITVGSCPTGVGVDNLRNLAVVANNCSNDISIVNLGSGTVVATIPSPTPSGNPAPLHPFAVGVNPLRGLAIIANQSANLVTVIDLTNNSVKGTISASTGDNPAVAIQPRLNWAFITPGGAGTLSIVDLGHLISVATATVGVSMRGIGLSPETEKALMVDPASTSVSIMSILDQTISQLPLELGHVAAAVNPFTDVGISVNPNLNHVSMIDLRLPTPALVATVPVGTDPRAVAIDPGSNVAVVANQGSNNVSILALGALRPLHIEQISPPATLTSATDLTVNVVGFGFTAGSQVRLDETAVATTFVSSRQLTATVPAAMLSSARRFALDVLDGSTRTNVSDFAVLQAIPVGNAPRAVAYDSERNLSVVANAASSNVSIVDNATGAVVSTISVGTNPQGVAVIPRAGLAVVTDRGSNAAHIINLNTNTVTTTINVGAEPIGVAINPATGFAYVANSAANSVSIFDAVAGGDVTSVTTDIRPVAIAIDPVRGRAAVAHASSNDLVLLSLTDNAILRRILGLQLPTGVAFDPVTGQFIALSSLTNNMGLVDPDSFQVTQVRVGINPTGVAYNFNSSTLMTVNTASRTATILDFVARSVRTILDLDVGATAPLQTCRVNPTDSNSVTQLCTFGVDVDVQRNVAVVADEGNNRLLIIPLPR